MPNIFVSYRREDSSGITGRICDYLKAAFGEEHLFKDVDSIPLGTDFREVIHAAVQRCDVLLAVIGGKWLSVRDGAGARRIDDPDDYVRLEIRSALERNIPVIPVMVDGAEVPKHENLPEPLQRLAFRNAIHVRSDPDFQHDMGRLCRDISRFLKLPDPGKRGETRLRRRWMVAAAACLLLATLLVIVAFRREDPLPPDVAGRLVLITNVTVIVQEYSRFQGKPLGEELKQLIEQAVASAIEGRHRKSVQLLEKIAAQAPLPSIYTNLGVEQAKLNNVDAAQAAFTRALEKDPEYQAALENRELLHIASAPKGKEAPAITSEPSAISAILVDPLVANPTNLKEIHVVVAGTSLSGFYNVRYSLKPGSPTIVSPGKYDLVFSAAEGGSFVLAKSVEVKEAQRIRIDPNILLGVILVEPLTRKEFPAIKEIRVLPAGTSGTRPIVQQSEKLGVSLPLVPGRYDIEGRTASDDYCTVLKNVEVKAQEVARIRTDEEVAGFVVRDPQLGAVKVNAIYVLKAGGNQIVAETKKFDQPMLVPAGGNYDIVIDQEGGRTTIRSNISAKRGELLKVP